jgi:hypothetical protein
MVGSSSRPLWPRVYSEGLFPCLLVLPADVLFHKLFELALICITALGIDPGALFACLFRRTTHSRGVQRGIGTRFAPEYEGQQMKADMSGFSHCAH